MSLPYYSSLNSQMAEYLKQVKMQEYNDTYQQAQLDIVLEGQRNLASQAEIMNRLKELQTQIANQAAQTIIPLSKTNAPEAAKQIEEQKFPTLTAAEYENKARTARKVPTMEELNFPEIVIDKYTPNNAIYDLKEIVIGDPNLSTQFKNELKKKLNNILKNPPKKEVRLKLPDDIINQIKSKNYKLKNFEKTKQKKEQQSMQAEDMATQYQNRYKNVVEKTKQKKEQQSMQAEDMATQYQNRYKNVVEKAKQKKEQQSMQAEDMATQYQNRYKNVVEKAKQKKEQESMQAEDINVKLKPGRKKGSKNKKLPIQIMIKTLKLKRNARGQFTKK